jgi:transcriptional regulator with XRE-family HTH domain
MVKEILRRSGLSQAELARRAGMPRSVVNVYLRGHREPGSGALARLAAAGGLQLELGKRKAPVDPYRAGHILVEVLELAEALPFRPKPELNYPRLVDRTGEGGGDQ